MEEFVRTRNYGVYSEIKESTPMIILYNPQSLVYYDKRLKEYETTSKECLDGVVGIHECYIINKGKNKKGYAIFQVYVKDLDVTLWISPNKWECYLQDISKDKFVLPTDENEYKQCTLDFYITESVNHDSLDYLDEIGKTDQRQSIREFVSSLAHIEIPLREINMEKDREMWQAYIDGQAAVNADNKELYKVVSVGNFEKVSYNGRKYTAVNLKLQATSLIDNTINDLRGILTTLYPDVSIEKKSDKVIMVSFPRYESLNEDLIAEIEEKVSEHCFKFDGKLTNELNGFIHLRSTEDFADILTQIDKSLYEDFGAEVRRNNGEYNLEDDDEMNFIHMFVDKAGYKDSVLTTTTTSLTVSFSLTDKTNDDEEDRLRRKKFLRTLVLDFLGNKKIKINASEGIAVLTPNSKEDYESLLSEIRSKLSPELSIESDVYKPQIKITLKTDDLDYCKDVFDKINKSIHSVRPDITLFCRNKDLYQEFEFKHKFTDETQLETMKQCVADELSAYNSLVELSYGEHPNGITSFNVVMDSAQLQRFSLTMQREFKLQEVRLINGEKYDEALGELNEKIEEKDNEWDWDVIDELKDEVKAKRRALTEVMGTGALRLGRCLSRSMDTVRFEVGKDFAERIQSFDGTPKSTDFIHVGDYVQFPLTGESAELSRQQESMYRITQPNTNVEIQGYWRKVHSPANPLLSQFLFDPRYAGDPTENIDELIKDIEKPGHHIEDRMNTNQKRAVATAVAAPDFAIIQGPPGTGKTTVIAEIIWQEIRRNPNVKILLTSQTNLAVDNALGRLKGCPGIRPIRILNLPNTPEERLMKLNKLKDDEKRYIEDQIDMWTSQPNEKNMDNGVQLWIDRIKNKISQDSKYNSALSLWNEELNCVDKMMRQQFATSYKEHINLVAATCSICGSWQFREKYTELFSDDEEAFDVVIMDEASKATPLEMAVPMVWGKKIIVIGDHKQLPPMMQEGNILDALKRIGRKDLADRIEQFKQSQFELLYEASSKLKNSLVAPLNEQYRMHEQIMNTINHFYKDEENGMEGLKCGIKDSMDKDDPSNGGSRYHGIRLEPFMNADRHVLWVDVPDYEDKQQAGSTSRTNKAEAEAIALVIKALKKAEGFDKFMASQVAKEDKEIGIITFYGAQAALLEEMKKNGKLDPSLSYRINVVDKFQGMERNIVIISTVRSNNEGAKGLGFTSDPRRINVGFSRAKSLLIIVGNRSFLSKNNADYARAISAIGNNRIDVQTLKHLVKNGKE